MTDEARVADEARAVPATIEEPESLPPALAIPHELPTGLDLAAATKMVETRVAFFKTARDATLRLTRSTDWRDFDGKPYLQAYGCERIAALWGIHVRDLVMTPSLEETRRALRSGEHVSVECWAKARSRVTGEETEFVGGRSSDDPFFADRRGGIETLDPEDLRKAAYTNLMNNVITRLSGLRGLAWDDLKPYGITREGAGGATTFAPSGESAGATRKQELLAELHALLVGLHGEEKAEAALYTLSKFTGDRGEVSLRTWADAQKAGEKWLQQTLNKARAAAKSTTPTAKPPEGSPPR